MIQSVAEIAESIEQSVKFEGWRSVPDPWGLRDLGHSPDLAAVEVERRQVTGPLWAEPFPLMRPDGRPRWLTVLGPFANEAIRASARDVVLSQDDWLSSRVLSNRARRHGTSWRTKPPKGILNKRKVRVFRMFSEGDAVGLVALDVREHYDSIDVPRLCEEMKERGAPAKDVESLARQIGETNRLTERKGLPIGPEFSGPLSNADLLPLDEALLSQGWDFVRVGDDFCVALRDGAELEQVPDFAAEFLGSRRECLADEKVQLFGTAQEWLQSRAVEASGLLALESPERASALEEFLDGLSSDRAKLNYEFRELARRRDPGGLDRVRQLPELWESNGSVIVRYVTELGSANRLAVEDVRAALPARPSATDESGHIFRLQLLSGLSSGRVEGLQCEKIATSPEWRSPSRAFAWKAYGASDAFDSSLATDVAIYEESSITARAAVLSLANEPSERERALCLRHIAAERPELTVSVRWVQDLN